MIYERLEENFEGQFGVIHSNKSQNYRLNTMASFQEGALRGIVTTDVMARGLDISDITHVINLEFPEITEQYIHRIGRTGRADKSGVAISLISPKEEEMLIEAEIMMDKELNILDLPDITIEERVLPFEKERIKEQQTNRRPKIERGLAFHDKSEKNKKVNLGGPGKRNPKVKVHNRNAVKTKKKK